MIYHSNALDLADWGRAVDDNGEWKGFNCIVSPTPLPPPTSAAAIDHHLQNGAILVYILHEPELFGNANDKLELQSTHYSTQINQRMLLLVANGEQRQIYQEPARQWMLKGGIAHVLPDSLEIGPFLQKLETGVEVRNWSLAEWLSIPAQLSKEAAQKLVDEYGSKVIELFSVSTEADYAAILDLPGFEGVSFSQLRKAREFFELDNGQELRLFDVDESETEQRNLTREFYSLAQELGGKVVEE